MILAGGFGTPCAGRDVGHCIPESGQRHIGCPVMPDQKLWGHPVWCWHCPSSFARHWMYSATACRRISQHNCHHTIFYHHDTLYWPSVYWHPSLPACSMRPGSPQERIPDRIALVVGVLPPGRHWADLHLYTSSPRQHLGVPIVCPWQASLLYCRLWDPQYRPHRGTTSPPPALTPHPHSTSPLCASSVWCRSRGRRLLLQYPATHTSMSPWIPTLTGSKTTHGLSSDYLWIKDNKWSISGLSQLRHLIEGSNSRWLLCIHSICTCMFDVFMHYVAAGLKLRSPPAKWSEGIARRVCTIF